ncbi:hypothetical protein N4839_14130, partial [Enterococcus faecalis]|nr:hypothetical protein [Enterococcus faecalis]
SRRRRHTSGALVSWARRCLSATGIGKLAHQYKLEGKKVLMAAADTFRAGAIDQLVVWGERASVEVVRGNAGGVPAAVVFDAVE